MRRIITIIGEAEYAVVGRKRTIIGDGEAEYADDIIRCYI